MFRSFDTAASGKNRRTGIVLLNPLHEMHWWSLEENRQKCLNKQTVFWYFELKREHLWPNVEGMCASIMFTSAKADKDKTVDTIVSKNKPVSHASKYPCKSPDYLIEPDAACLSGGKYKIRPHDDGVGLNQVWLL